MTSFTMRAAELHSRSPHSRLPGFSPPRHFLEIFTQPRAPTAARRKGGEGRFSLSPSQLHAEAAVFEFTRFGRAAWLVILCERLLAFPFAPGARGRWVARATADGAAGSGGDKV